MTTTEKNLINEDHNCEKSKPEMQQLIQMTANELKSVSRRESLIPEWGDNPLLNNHRLTSQTH